jgi:hypothetical protein
MLKGTFGFFTDTESFEITLANGWGFYHLEAVSKLITVSGYHVVMLGP